jgi:hypothetical protein
MKTIRLLFLLLLFTSAAFGQIDSFAIAPYTFKFIVPEGWTSYSKDNGLCEYSETNVNLKMPLKNNKCYGNLSISISEITETERKTRNIPDTTNDPLMLDNSTYPKEVADFMTAGGYYEARLDNDTFYYVDAWGSLITKKKISTNKKLTEVHRYARWCYFPVNDSLEILISFSGLIPHSEESNADAAMSQVAWYFFYHNESQLDSLIKNTSPFRNEPEILPIDSIIFLKSNLKYPVIPGWQCDTTRVVNQTTTTLLRLKTNTPDSCDVAAITVSYCMSDSDPRSDHQQKLLKKVPSHLSKQMKQDVPPIDPSILTKNHKQHYFFFQNSGEENNPHCSQIVIHADSVNIFIYTKFNQRIKISVSLQASSADSKNLNRYFHGYSRFLIAFIEANDFEKIYQINYQPE